MLPLLLVLLPLPGQLTNNEPQAKLSEYAAQHFSRENGPADVADTFLFDSLGRDQIADFADQPPLRAITVKWLCTDNRAIRSLPNGGLRIRNAKILGALDLSFTTLTFPLALEHCTVAGGIDLDGATALHINLRGSHLGSLRGEGLEVRGDLLISKGFKTGLPLWHTA